MRLVHAMWWLVPTVGLGAHTLHEAMAHHAPVMAELPAVLVDDPVAAAISVPVVQPPSDLDTLLHGVSAEVEWTERGCHDVVLSSISQRTMVLKDAQSQDNPVYVSLQLQHDAQTDVLASLMAQEEAVRGEMHVLEQRHALALSRLEHLQREREQARRAVDPLRETQRGITTRLSRAMAAEESIAAYNQQRQQLQAQRRQPQDTVRSPLRPPASETRKLAAQIPALRAQLAQHNRRQQRAENTAEQAARQHSAQQQQVDALVADQREQEETLAALMAAEDQQRAVLRDVVAQMAGLAPSIMEKVTEEVTYPVQTIARRCTVQATVTWRDGQATVYAAQQEDIDTVHEAAAQGQVAEDPLRFVRTDQQRLQAAEQEVFAQVQRDAGCCMVDAVANNR